MGGGWGGACEAGRHAAPTPERGETPAGPGRAGRRRRARRHPPRSPQMGGHARGRAARGRPPRACRCRGGERTSGARPRLPPPSPGLLWSPSPSSRARPAARRRRGGRERGVACGWQKGVAVAVRLHEAGAGRGGHNRPAARASEDTVRGRRRPTGAAGAAPTVRLSRSVWNGAGGGGRAVCCCCVAAPPAAPAAPHTAATSASARSARAALNAARAPANARRPARGGGAAGGLSPGAAATALIRPWRRHKNIPRAR